MNETALQIRRYNLGLMTHEENAAFERTLSQSPELQREFRNVGNMLSATYLYLAEGMPEPEKELKDTLLARIKGTWDSERAEMLVSGAIASSVGLIPSTTRDARPYAAGGDPTVGISSGIKKIITPLIIVMAATLFLIGMSNSISSESPNAPISSFEQNHTEAGADMNRNFQVLSQASGGSKRSSILFISTKNTNVHNTITASQLPPKDNAEENLRIFDIRSVETLLPVITSENPILAKQDKNVANPLDHTSIANENDALYSEMAWGERISFSISRISTLKFYPGRLDMATVPPMNNWGAALKYAVTPVIAIGIEAGRETFPFYREKSDDMYDEFYSVTWGGASVTVSDPELEFFDCHPEARAVAGFGTAGPMGKISAGFIWQPSHTISFSPELEYTGVYVKNTGVFIEGQDGVSSGGKLGFTASMAIRF